MSCHQEDYDGVANPNHRAPRSRPIAPSCHTTTSLVGRHLRPRRDAVPAHRRARRGHLRLLPRRRRLRREAHHLRLVPPAGLRRHHHARPTRAWRSRPTAQSCHTTSGWPGGKFNHATTQFPLTGAHLPLACAQCHGDGVWRGKPTACVACHQRDYDRRDDPESPDRAVPDELHQLSHDDHAGRAPRSTTTRASSRSPARTSR